MLKQCMSVTRININLIFKVLMVAQLCSISIYIFCSGTLSYKIIFKILLSINFLGEI